MKKLLSLVAALLLIGNTFAATYNLVKVTEVKDGGLYVFERNGHVLDAVVTKNVAQTTDDYLTAGLTGQESYVWSLSGNATDGFSIRSEKKYADDPTGHIYLNNPSKTNMSMSNESTSAWTFTFDGDVALIANKSNSDRFLGETENGSNEYKAYAVSNLSTYGHDFTVYELQSATTPYITVTPAAADFGTKGIGNKAGVVELQVTFGNLKGEVTYSKLSDPFTVSGTIAKSGDKLSIIASTATEGEYSQKLIIESVDDKVSAEVIVKMTVADLSAGNAVMTGEIVEGDYVITYGESALKAAVAEKTNRFEYETITLSGGLLTDPDASIIWHIAPAGEYWTLYNKSTGKYAGGNDTKNQGALLDDASSDFAKWIITGTDTYEFENVGRGASGNNPGNKWLRNNVQNGTNYGFACYSSSTGGALTLYKVSGQATAVEQTEVEAKAVKVMENGQVIIMRDGIRYNAQGIRLP
ncbi:MAG: hypothetical protein IJT35_01750 [Paludibacteraceae bacterium]|nr:hypothetical protein [Paludibacteraceae bacterium]